MSVRRSYDLGVLTRLAGPLEPPHVQGDGELPGLELWRLVRDRPSAVACHGQVGVQLAGGPVLRALQRLVEWGDICWGRVL
jgi:hypothetical protein